MDVETLRKSTLMFSKELLNQIFLATFSDFLFLTQADHFLMSSFGNSVRFSRLKSFTRYRNFFGFMIFPAVKVDFYKNYNLFDHINKLFLYIISNRKTYKISYSLSTN